jgi:hypothetical protein
VKHPRSLWHSLLAAAALAGCGREEPIRVYEASATPRPQVLEMPATWRPVPLTQKDRGAGVLYNFEAGRDPNKVQINVSALGGGLLANVNRWRRQLSLPPIEGGELAQLLVPLKVDQYAGNYIELVAPENPPEPDPNDPAAMLGKKRPAVRDAIYGAIIAAKGHQWVFRLKGPVAAAERERANFKTFVENGLRAIAAAVHESKSEEPADGN